MSDKFQKQVRFYIYVLHAATFLFFALVFLISLSTIEDKSDQNALFQLYWSGFSAAVHPFFMLAYWFFPGLVRSPLMRLASLVSGIMPVMIAHALVREIDITDGIMYPLIAWVVIMYYDLALEWRFATFSLSFLYAAFLIIQHVIRDHYAYLGGFPFLRTSMGALMIKIFSVSFIVLALRLFARKDEERYRLTLEQENRIAEQEALLTELEALQAESESRRQEAEARYAEAQRLQKELAREVARTALTARYEALMRDQYGKPLSDFLRALLESLQDDLGFVAGLAYQVKDEVYEVVATYALPQHMGRTFSGGLLETATALKKPYLIAVSSGHAPPLPGLAKLHPRYALYLPVYADVSGSGVIAVLEILLLHAPEAEKVALIGELLPRLGSYLWMQQASLQA